MSRGEASDDKSQLHSSLTLLERARAGGCGARLLIAGYPAAPAALGQRTVARWARRHRPTRKIFVQETLFQTFKRH